MTEAERECVFGLYGAGGFAREVMPTALYALKREGFRSADIQACFLETTPAKAVKEVNGHQILSETAFMALSSTIKRFNVAIADSSARETICERMLDQKLEPMTLIGESTIIGEYNEIGVGAIICPFVTITANSRIGRFFHANLYCYVAHDCVLGDYVTFAPRVQCNGNVHIGDHAYIGSGAILKQGSRNKPLKIGAHAIVGMGAVVTKDVPAGATVVGNPARPMLRR